MLIHNIKDVLLKFYKDDVARIVVLVILLLSTIISVYVSIILGFTVFFLFINGCAISVIALNHKDDVAKLLRKAKDFFGYKDYINELPNDCDVCGTSKCPRHNKSTVLHEPWKNFNVEDDLDKSVDLFYSHIINNFISSWYSSITRDEEFILSLKRNLRDATCRLIIKIKEINAPVLITNKLLPTLFIHYEIISKMLLVDHIPMDKLSKTFLINDYPIHPAVLNRKAELDYLRGVAKCLIPRLLTIDNISSKIIFNLIKELLTFWVLLPLMDVISDPNLINLLIITATNPRSSDNKLNYRLEKKEKVEFLKRFVSRKVEPTIVTEECDDKDENILKDQSKLYSFMQFLKKEGAVDLLRFYLDVDNLNNELMDPRITTDPTKLSSLYQQSEKLLQTYQAMIKRDNEDTIVNTLTEAHEHVKRKLESKWQQQFHKTSEYFKLIYGNREIKEHADPKGADSSISSVTKLSSKLKGAIRGAVDGAPIEAMEIPTVWDALQETQVNSSTNIYSSVTQKLRKEKGQSLDAFMATFMHSIEQCPDLGEDVIEVKEKPKKKSKPPGQSLVFGDLFELHKPSKHTHTTTLLSHSVRGPSQCFIYILVKILRAPYLLVRLALALCCVSQKTVDLLICNLLQKLLGTALKETRLAILINLLREHIFIKKSPETTPQELLKRQQLARQRLENVKSGLSNVFDVLQSPALNKHLMYCLFDIVLGEIYPEFDETLTNAKDKPE